MELRKKFVLEFTITKSVWKVLQIHVIIVLDFCSNSKPGSHLCDKHNTSEISISTRKKGTCSFFLMLMLMLISIVLCLSHKCEPGLTDLHVGSRIVRLWRFQWKERIYKLLLLYSSVSQAWEWELPNSRTWVAEIDIDRGLDFPI